VPQHQETRFLPYTPEQLFNLVYDVKSYPEFLPWCIGARIGKTGEDWQLADLIIGFKAIRQRFTSKVERNTKTLEIHARMIEGPFHHLTNYWHFQQEERDGKTVTLVSFEVDFAFNSRLLSKIIEPLFGEAQKKLVAAFEKRAGELYGTSSLDFRPS